jgi:hypothetical protein
VKTEQPVEAAEYGDKVQAEATQDNLEVSAAVEAENMPAPPPAEPVSPASPQPVEEQWQPKSLMDAVPPGLLFQRGKRPYEQRYDISLLWDVLAEDPNVDPVIAAIAQRLKGE